MTRRAKIVCTLGPATESAESIRELVDAGMDVARLNLSHGTHDDHAKVHAAIQEDIALGREAESKHDHQAAQDERGKRGEQDQLAHQSELLAEGGKDEIGGVLRNEFEVGLRALFDRYPDLREAGRPVRRDTRVLQGYSSMPVTLGQRSGAHA